MEQDLKEFLQTGKGWDRIKTKTPGLFIRKLPGSAKRGSSLAIELNPPDQDGNPTKKNGLFIRTSRDVDFYKKMLEHPQIPKVLEMLSKVNPAQEEERILDI